MSWITTVAGMKCGEVGPTISDRKTQIVKLSHGFTYLKVRVFLTSTGNVVKKFHPPQRHPAAAKAEEAAPAPG